MYEHKEDEGGGIIKMFNDTIDGSVLPSLLVVVHYTIYYMEVKQVSRPDMAGLEIWMT